VYLYTSILLLKEQYLQGFTVKKIVASSEFSVIIAACSTAAGRSSRWSSDTPQKRGHSGNARMSEL
jgi:hypothetical protein